MARRPTRDVRGEVAGPAVPWLVRLIRVFVSSPSDVAEERRVLDEVVERVNETAEARGVQLKLFKWERDVVPRIGPPAQQVIDEQTPPYDIYLGILKHRFGTPTGRYGSGTEKEFRDALKRWGAAGEPWILFYFSAEPVPPDRLDEALRVQRFRKELEKKGLYATYKGARDGKDPFVHKVEGHLRKLVERLAPPAEASRRDTGAARAPGVPAEYRAWLKAQCSSLDLEGLKPKQAMVVPLNAVYVPLTTHPPRNRPERRPRRSAYLAGKFGWPSQISVGRRGQSSCSTGSGPSRLYVPGDPGSGKSTFCRRVAWLACEGKMPRDTVPAPDWYAETFPAGLRNRLPLLVTLRDFWRFLPTTPGVKTLTIGELEQALERWVESATAAWARLVARQGSHRAGLGADHHRRRRRGATHARGGARGCVPPSDAGGGARPGAATLDRAKESGARDQSAVRLERPRGGTTGRGHRPASGPGRQVAAAARVTLVPRARG